MAGNAPHLEHVKQLMKLIWTSGDFGKIAELMQRSGEEFVERLNLKPGTRVLDVGCGTGNQSLPAARAGAQVTGSISLRTCWRRRWSAQNKSIFKSPSEKATPKRCRLRMASSTL